MFSNVENFEGLHGRGQVWKINEKERKTLGNVQQFSGEKRKKISNEGDTIKVRNQIPFYDLHKLKYKK